MQYATDKNLSLGFLYCAVKQFKDFRLLQMHLRAELSYVRFKYRVKNQLYIQKRATHCLGFRCQRPQNNCGLQVSGNLLY